MVGDSTLFGIYTVLKMPTQMCFSFLFDKRYSKDYYKYGQNNAYMNLHSILRPYIYLSADVCNE